MKLKDFFSVVERCNMTDVIVDFDKTPDLVFNVMTLWIHENIGLCGEEWHWMNGDRASDSSRSVRFVFKSEESAMAFKLRWL